MKLQLIHLSDMHFENKSNPFEINIDKMMQAINSVMDADECIIVVSGDLAAKGTYHEYKYVSSLVGAISKKLREDQFLGKNIEVVCVPGNHDIYFPSLNTDFYDVVKAYKDNQVEELIKRYLSNMGAFYKFAHHRKCFLDDEVVSKKVVTYGDIKIGFVMLNTAPLSVLGGNSEDMGSHFLTARQMKLVESATEAQINILVMHHSIEWFHSSCKDGLRKIISQKYSLALTGHEHTPVGESRKINGLGEIQIIQGNALYGYTEDGNGFCAVNIDLQNNNMNAYSFMWNGKIYVAQAISDGKLKSCWGNELIVKSDFVDTLDRDANNNEMDNYYVFPSLTYHDFNEKEDVEKHDVESETELMEILSQYNKIVITGDNKAGKTLLAKRLFKNTLKEGKIPLIINASDIIKKKIDKTIEYVFGEQYEVANDAYQIFNQLDKTNKVAILDDAHLINKNVFNTLLNFLEMQFGQVVIFSEEKVELNIRQQVVDAMVEAETLVMVIKPFLYVKRKKLISNILSCDKDRKYDVGKETKKINELINTQVKYFHLNPEFIINFVYQYEKDHEFRFSSGMNVFNIVYESSIKNRIITNSDNIDATIVINILRELAYYMHFGRKGTIRLDEITELIEHYNKEYRQKVNVRQFLDAAINAKVLVDMDNDIRFKDHTLIAYFVAQALNQKYYQEEDITENLEHLLKNLCFSINSDIVLFLALITNNPKFVNIIMEGAKAHFAEKEELSFDKENIKFLLDTSIPVKNTLPDENERMQRDETLQKQEEEVKFSDLVELVNEYDYSEDDLEKIENQIMISFKYLEILSKALPAFCQNMKAEQQDSLVELIYKCPNQFLYMILKDIGDNFEEFCNGLYNEISALRKEKNIAEVNIESVKHMIEQISALLVMALYQVVASTSTTEQSTAALNEFDFSLNSNYKLQNLMMMSHVADVASFSRRAQELKKELDSKLEQSIIKYTVREYLLRNQVELYGEAQSLVDNFFGGQSTQKLKMEIAKKRITEKDRI